jgi:alkylation response protein AidB-like acyl-CoA dehydrogenase
MDFGLSDSQQSLKDNARKFFSMHCPMAEVRRLAETDSAHDEALWKKMAEQGYTGICFSEEHDGAGLGLVELALILEEAGRALLPGPFFSSVALAGALLEATASEEQKKKYLAPICRGEARSTVAVYEAESGWNTAEARIAAGNGRLSGEKLFVPDAAVASTILVAGRDSVYVVEAGAPGMSITPLRAMDLTRKVYAVTFASTPAEKLARPENLERGLDCATAALTAEMTGGMQRTLESAVQYAKTRKQFGKIIGSFQAVQNLCADMLLETESSRSAAYYAAWALQENAADAAAAVSIAKLYASDACRTVGNRGIQIHGGMGFTWENDLHLYYRRAKASETTLGDASWHRERLARLVVDTVAVPRAGV